MSEKVSRQVTRKQSQGVLNEYREIGEVNQHRENTGKWALFKAQNICYKDRLGEEVCQKVLKKQMTKDGNSASRKPELKANCPRLTLRRTG